jgi:hypothetical protein
MKLGTENRRQTIIAAVGGVLALGACIYIYEELFATGPAPAQQAPGVVAGAPNGSAGNGAATGSAPAGDNAAKTVGKSSTALDPTLHMEAMLVSESVEYSGTGRNIFSASSVPVGPMPEAIAKARLNTTVVTPPTPPVAKTCPPDCPPPPPIPLKFFGFETSAKGTRQAFLLHDDDVILASAGDVVVRRYRVVSIDAKSIQVEDMQNNNRQTLPLLTN